MEPDQKRFKEMNSENVNEDTPMESNEGLVLNIFQIFKFPTIAESILKFLPARELLSCARTCTLWYVLSTSLLRKRHNSYVLTMIGKCAVKSYEILLNDPLLAPHWSKSTLAIFFGSSHTYATLDSYLLYFTSNAHNLSKENEQHLKRKFAKSIMAAKEENKICRNYLPRNCTVVHIMHPTWADRSSVPTPCISMLLIPSIPGVEVQPFIIPPQSGINFDTREIEHLYLSKNKNFLKSNIKCIMVFSNITDALNKDTYTNTIIKKYLSEETIIVGGYENVCHTNIGIAFSGESIEVKCIALGEHFCCARCYFTILKKCFKEENGLAFVMQQSSRCLSCFSSLWSEFFPKITPFVLWFDRISYFIPNRERLLQTCNKCNSQLESDLIKTNDMVIIFVLIKDFNCEAIQY